MKKKTAKTIRRALMLLALVGLIALVAISSMPKPTAVELGSATRGPLVVTIDESGRTRVKDRLTIAAPIAGDLARITFRAGDRVAEGDVLLRIAPMRPALMNARSRSAAQAQLAEARAAQRQAMAGTARAEAARDLAQEMHTRRGLGRERRCQ